jgi:hypothetical protein
MPSADEPILLVGAPRSGTTLLRALLNRHPSIGLCDETYFHFWMARRADLFGDLADATRRARAVDRYLELRRVKRMGLDLAALREHLLATATTYPDFFLELMRFHARASGKIRCGEKSPHHALVARELLEWFPAARLIHLVRDPRDVVASLRRMPWSSGSLLTDARLWRDCVDGVERCAAPPNLLVVRYETLIAQPEAELRRICDFIHESFDAAMLCAGPPARTDRWWSDRAQGSIDSSRLFRWREELAHGDVARVEWVAGERLARYGYAAVEPPAGAVTKQRGRVGAVGARLVRALRHLPAAWWRWRAPDRIALQERVYDKASDRDP